MYIVVSIFDRCTCMFRSFSYFFYCFHTTTDSRALYHDMRHSPCITVQFQFIQRTGACKCHVIAAVLRLRVQKLTPAELRPFCHAKREHCNNFSRIMLIFSLSVNMTLKQQWIYKMTIFYQLPWKIFQFKKRLLRTFVECMQVLMRQDLVSERVRIKITIT